MQNSTHICMPTLYFHPRCTSSVLVGKQSLSFISTVNRTISFDPEFLCAIEISRTELALLFNIQNQNCIIVNACEIFGNVSNANIGP